MNGSIVIKMKKTFNVECQDIWFDQQFNNQINFVSFSFFFRKHLISGNFPSLLLIFIWCDVILQMTISCIWQIIFHFTLKFQIYNCNYENLIEIELGDWIDCFQPTQLFNVIYKSIRFNRTVGPCNLSNNSWNHKLSW